LPHPMRVTRTPSADRAARRARLPLRVPRPPPPYRRDVTHDHNVASGRPGPRTVVCEELVTGGGDPGVDLGQRLATGRAKSGLRRHSRHTPAGTSRRGGSRTRRSRPRSSAHPPPPGSPGRGLGRVSRARRRGLVRKDRTGPYKSGRTEAACARPFSVSSTSLRPTSSACALADDSPCRTRISMPALPVSGSGPECARTGRR